MRGDNHTLIVTTKIVTHEDDPTIPVGESREEPLFAFPIQVAKATDAKADPRFDNAAPSGAEYVVTYVDPVSGETFPYEERKRGIRVGETFAEIEATAIAAIDEAVKTRDMRVLGSCDLADVPMERAKGSYFLQAPPKGGSAKAYRLIYEALLPAKKKGQRPATKAKALVAKRVARTRQKLCVIYADPNAKCLRMVELAFAAELKQPDEAILAPQVAEVAEAQIDAARQVIAALGDGFAAIEGEVDEAVALKEALIERAVAGEVIAAPTPQAAVKANDDLEDQLLASLAALGG